MKENKKERKHLIITDGLELCLALMEDDVDRMQLINSLINAINDEKVNLDDLYSTTEKAFLYFTDEKRIKSLIFEENMEEKK